MESSIFIDLSINLDQQAKLPVQSKPLAMFFGRGLAAKY